MVLKMSRQCRTLTGERTLTGVGAARSDPLEGSNLRRQSRMLSEGSGGVSPVGCHNRKKLDREHNR